MSKPDEETKPVIPKGGLYRELGPPSFEREWWPEGWLRLYFAKSPKLMAILRRNRTLKPRW